MKNNQCCPHECEPRIIIPGYPQDERIVLEPIKHMDEEKYHAYAVAFYDVLRARAYGGFYDALKKLFRGETA